MSAPSRVLHQEANESGSGTLVPLTKLKPPYLFQGIDVGILAFVPEQLWWSYSIGTFLLVL